MADTTFTYGPSNVTTLLTTTNSKRRKGKEIQDAVFNEMVLLSFLHDKHRTTEDGGATILVPIMSAGSNAAQFYDGYEEVNVNPQEGFTLAQYKWKQASAPITVSGREDRIQNAGSSEVIRIVDAKTRQAELSLKDMINQAFFTTSPASTAIGSLVTSIDATSTIGDINSSSNTFWQASVTASGSFAAQGLTDVRTKFNLLSSRNPVGGLDLLLSDQASFEYYEAALQPQQRFAGTVGNGSFENLMFKSAPWTYDLAATSGVIYFLNSDALEFVVHSGTDFIMTDWVRPSPQDAKSALLLLGAELTVCNRRKLGKLTGVSA